MKYAAQKEREKSAKILSLRDSQQDEVNEPAIDEEELKLFFKTCVLGDPEQLEKLREVLRTTISLRDKILADPNVNLIESFPFFYIDQNLVNIIYYDSLIQSLVDNIFDFLFSRLTMTLSFGFLTLIATHLLNYFHTYAQAFLPF